MSRRGLAPRGAFHAAHALDGGRRVFVSSDPDRDDLAERRSLGPPR